ncbi:hypothetical protein PBP221_77190 (plasmid) [Paraburkholderia sp. 22B1P]|nr:hypothetical protein PBP221_77190 [Paraburkholderia sp. 22B1P]
MEISAVSRGNATSKNNTLQVGATLNRYAHTTTARRSIEDLVSMLATRGYLTGDGKVLRDVLRRDFLAAFSAGFEDSRLAACALSRATLDQVTRSVLQRTWSAHPVAVALVRTALDKIEYTRSPAPSSALP